MSVSLQWLNGGAGGDHNTIPVYINKVFVPMLRIKYNVSAFHLDTCIHVFLFESEMRVLFL